MKGLIGLVCIVLLIGAGSNIAAQADCGYRVLFDVRNGANNPIINAKLKLGGRKTFFYRPQLGKYETGGLLGVGAPDWKTNLNGSAKGYKSFNRELVVSCSRFGEEYLLILRPKRSKLEAEFRIISKVNK